MKVVYIAHPISGDIKGNLEKIRLIIRNLNLTHEGIVPFAPYWLDCHALDDTNPDERIRGITNDTYLIRRCVDEMWLYGDRISNGMKAEIEWAKTLGIPIYCKSELIFSWMIDEAEKSYKANLQTTNHDKD